MGLLYNGVVVMHGVQRVSLIISLKGRDSTVIKIRKIVWREREREGSCYVMLPCEFFARTIYAFFALSPNHSHM